MDTKLLHTPEGVRDVMGNEYEKKLKLSNDIMKLIETYGYSCIETPTIEFFDIFSNKIGTIPSKELYKFFDKEGNTLCLRPDFTPSIARACAKYFMEEIMPIRLSYMGSSFVNASDYQGKLKESTQIGAELINDGSVFADVEILMMVIESMLKCNLTEFQVSIGNLEFFKGLCSEYNIDETTELELRDMINDKNLFGTQDILDSLKLDNNTKNIFIQMPEMFGGIEKIHEAKSFVSNSRSLKALERLEDIYELLKTKGYDKYVSFDLGMLSKYNYYTGIIFRAYTYGSGDAIIKGGRYDNLLNEFSKDAEAVGFTIGVDQLLTALERQKIPMQLDAKSYVFVLFEENMCKDAYTLAKEARSKGKNVILCSKKRDIALDNYKKYAQINNYEFTYMK